MSEQRYTLAELYRRGQISAKVFNYKEITDKVAQLMAAGSKKSQAVQIVAGELGWDKRSIYRALAKSL